MTDTTELVKRLEAGADWLSKEIDDLTRALFGTSYTFKDWGLVDDAVKGSLDAAVALVERVRPEWTIARIGQDDYKHWHCELREGHQTSYDRVVITMKFATPAAALLAALLKAEG